MAGLRGCLTVRWELPLAIAFLVALSTITWRKVATKQFDQAISHSDTVVGKNVSMDQWINFIGDNTINPARDFSSD